MIIFCTQKQIAINKMDTPLEMFKLHLKSPDMMVPISLVLSMVSISISCISWTRLLESLPVCISLEISHCSPKQLKNVDSYTC